METKQAPYIRVLRSFLPSMLWIHFGLVGMMFGMPLGLSYAEAKPSKLTPNDVLLLKQVGYTEEQIIQQIKKAGMLGKFTMTPTQIRTLLDAGFSARLLQLMQTGQDIATPVPLKELQAWLQQKKPETWIQKQLQRRGIVKREYGPLSLLVLRRSGASLSLLQMLRHLQSNKKPTAQPQPTSPKNLPIMPGVPIDLSNPPTQPTNPRNQPPSRRPLQLPSKISRWGRNPGRTTTPITVRDQRLAQRQATLVQLPKNRVYRHVTNQYSWTLPQGWSLLEDVDPETGQFHVYATQTRQTRPLQIQQGISISLDYLPKERRFLATSSLLLLARTQLQQALSRETGLREVLPLGLAKFQKEEAATVTLLGKERGQTLTRKIEHIVLRHGNMLAHIRYFAAPEKFAAFTQQAKQVLQGLRWQDPEKARGSQRLKQAVPVQEAIQKNTKAVVSISIGIKKKGKITLRAAGTGFVVTPNGYVITNQHVAVNRFTGKPYAKYVLNWDHSTGQASVEARFIKAHRQLAQRRQVRLIDPKTGRISVRYQRQHVDIALLKITKPGTYSTVKLSPIQSGMLGDTVVALGFPLEGRGVRQLGNEDITATTGRISRLVRMGNGQINEIQHTAKIAGGNSGGPLFDNYTGGVIGINTWVGIFDRRQARPGMGLGYYYALPINLAWQFFPDYIDISTQRYRHIHWYEVGRHWLAQGRYTTATRAFLRCVKAKPNFAPAYVQLSALYLRRALRYNNNKRANYLKLSRRWADRGLQKDNEHAELMNLLAQTAIHRGEWQTAKYLLQKLRQHRPNDWNVHALQATMHVRTGNLKGALREADQVIQLAGTLLPIGHLMRGQILYKAKRYFEGQQSYRKALRIAPNNLQAKIGELLGYTHLKQRDEALLRIARLKKAFPDEPAVFRAELFTHTVALQYEKGWQAFQKYHQRCMLRAIPPDAASLFVGGLLAQRVVSPTNRSRIVWGLWGSLLQDHTTTNYAARAGIILASQAKKLGYNGLTYGIIRLLRDLVKDPKLRPKILRISAKLQPRGLSRRALFFVLLKTYPRWNPYLIWKLFRLTPSIINKSTAILLIRRGVPAPLVRLMFFLSKKRVKLGVKPNPRTTPKRTPTVLSNTKGTPSDQRAIVQACQLAFKALQQGDLDLWMSLYYPKGNRTRYKLIFRNLSQALSNGRFVYKALPRTKILWRKLQGIGLTARYYFRARLGKRLTKLYYWKTRKVGTRWYLY